MAGWLKEGGCEMIAMESTGSYWKPLYNIFEFTGLDAIVVNPADMKSVPGRKTDVKDAEWIADLLRHGLLNPSFIPDKAQRELRELLKYRKSLVEDRARELNRIQKLLEGANIKLSGTVSDINGKSSRNMLNAVISGEKIDIDKINEMIGSKQVSTRLKATKEQLVDDLTGVMTPTQCKLAREMFAHVKELDGEIDEQMDPGEKDALPLLETMPGIGKASAEIVIGVIGTDMSRFPTDGHISSWAGLSPGNNTSAGKSKPAKSNKGNQLLHSTLILCAHSAVRVKSSYFYAQIDGVFRSKFDSLNPVKGLNISVSNQFQIPRYKPIDSRIIFYNQNLRHMRSSPFDWSLAVLRQWLKGIISISPVAFLFECPLIHHLAKQGSGAAVAKPRGCDNIGGICLPVLFKVSKNRSSAIGCRGC
jgi:transposase